MKKDYYDYYKKMGLNLRGTATCVNCQWPLTHVMMGATGEIAEKCDCCGKVSLVNLETMETKDVSPCITLL